MLISTFRNQIRMIWDASGSACRLGCLNSISVSGSEERAEGCHWQRKFTLHNDWQWMRCSRQPEQNPDFHQLNSTLISLYFAVVGVYILIAAGALMMVVGFLGCCGAIKESPCMLGLVSTTRHANVASVEYDPTLALRFWIRSTLAPSSGYIAYSYKIYI